MSCICIRVARSIRSPARAILAASMPSLRRSSCACSSMRGERRPQLVGQDRQELILGAVRLLGLGPRLLGLPTRCLSASMSTSDRMAPSILLSVVL